MIYDIGIIGTGPSAFGVLEGLKSKDYKGSIIIIDKGKMIEDRTQKDRMHGFGGAGLYTDMKLMIDPYTGGDLGVIDQKFMDYIFKSKDFYIKNGAPNEIVQEDCTYEISLFELFGFKFVPTYQLIHCGTDRATPICKNIFDYFNDLNVTWKFLDEIFTIGFLDDKYLIYENDQLDPIQCEKVVIATGRSNSLKNLDKLEIEYDNNVVDIGVRCEIDHNTPMKPYFDKFYHPKIEYITPTYGDRVRTFCTNPQGYVTIENYDNFKLMNGETYKNKKTDRTNFAILVSIPFTEPFKDGNEFARKIAQTVCQLNNNKPIVQSYRDLLHGRRSTLNRILNINYQIDINEVCPGDLSIVLPYRYLKDIMEFINNLDKMFTGIVDNMLLYGLEAKFYANKPKMDSNFQAKNNLYFAGDCSGITRGIIQATAMGIYIGEQL